MKILLITYYWPPAGGSGVQRWLKFIKYFSCFGIDPIVYTVENPNYAVEDESLLSEVPVDLQVLREPIWEPNNVLSKFKNNEKNQSAGFLNPDPSFLQRQMHYIRANYFIPDARKYWIKPSVRKLTAFLKENPVDVIISTGPPHSVHMIGAELKRICGVKWLADFRDPWTNIDYFHNLPLTDGARKKHHELENKVLMEADAVIVVGKTMREEFIDRNQNTYVISNGFDEQVEDSEVAMDTKFSISHIGMMNADRNPKIFWQALRELIDENEDFSSDLSVKLIGKCDDEVYQSVEALGLNDHVNFVAYVAHKDVLKFQRSSQLLLLAVNDVPSSRSVITGKVFEYLQSKRPIIGIGPVDGDLAEILNKTEAGQMVDFDDLLSLKKMLLKYYEAFKTGQLLNHTKNIDRYHRKNLTKELATILKSL
ncbi:glycosyltransferase [Lutimonas halocynthiae]|uniref:glycosyltransferase n=1 Tax=Lutimonas halocynthiae TaxID=1446477 RepID=UPI0025B5E848|nr:glycosyltransferase [Lutimonas halocynthiae]MDN3642361.1 glycosyltransferase [Lutimonas halocynthiae]